MSYSFEVTAATKPEAIAAVSAELDEVVASQPIHAADRAAAQAAAETFIILLANDAEKDIKVSVHGSVSTWGRDDGQPVGVGVGISASLVTRP